MSCSRLAKGTFDRYTVFLLTLIHKSSFSFNKYHIDQTMHENAWGMTLTFDPASERSPVVEC